MWKKIKQVIVLRGENEKQRQNAISYTNNIITLHKLFPEMLANIHSGWNSVRIKE